MKRFKAIAKNGFKVGIVYRAHFFVTLIGVPVSLLIYYFLWKSIFSYSGQEILNGYTFLEMITYYAVSMVVAMLTYVDVDDWLGHDVRSGVVIADFLRPFKFIWNFFAVSIGLNSLAILIQVIPLTIIAVFFIKVGLPSPIFALLFAVSVVMALFLNYFFTFCVGLLAFWFNEIYGLRKVKNAVKSFLEGGLIPLTFFPLTFQLVFKYLPFQYMRFVPINLFLQKYAIKEALILLLIQLIWIFVFYFIAVWFYKKSFKKFAGVGV